MDAINCLIWIFMRFYSSNASNLLGKKRSWGKNFAKKEKFYETFCFKQILQNSKMGSGKKDQTRVVFLYKVCSIGLQLINILHSCN